MHTLKQLKIKHFDHSLDKEAPTYNSTYKKKVAVQFSADTFVVNQTLILRINICGENRHLRQADKTL